MTLKVDLIFAAPSCHPVWLTSQTMSDLNSGLYQSLEYVQSYGNELHCQKNIH